MSTGERERQREKRSVYKFDAAPSPVGQKSRFAVQKWHLFTFDLCICAIIRSFGRVTYAIARIRHQFTKNGHLHKTAHLTLKRIFCKNQSVQSTKNFAHLRSIAFEVCVRFWFALSSFRRFKSPATT